MSDSAPQIRGLDRGQRAALVISECQQVIVDPELSAFKSLAEQVAQRNLLAGIAKLAEHCRTAAVPVIHCTIRLLPEAQAFKSCSPLHSIVKRNPLMQQQHPESNIHPDLQPKEGD